MSGMMGLSQMRASQWVFKQSYDAVILEVLPGILESLHEYKWDSREIIKILEFYTKCEIKDYLVLYCISNKHTLFCR